MMFLGLVVASRALIVSATWSEAKILAEGKRTFVLALSSDTYEATSVLESFTRAVRESRVDGNFVIVDTWRDNLTADDLKVPSLPAVMYFHRGHGQTFMKTELEFDTIHDFVSTHGIPEVRRITDEKGLQEWFDTAAMGVLCAFENASDETLPVFSDMHQQHFQEVEIAWCDHSLVEKPGFYFYRHIDNAFIRIEKNMFEMTPAAVEEVLSELTVPEFFKADMEFMTFMEREKTELVNLVFDTKGGFYLTPEQVEMAKDIKNVCGINVTFETVDHHTISRNRYGFTTEVIGDEMRIINFSSSPRMKYRISGELTPENAKRLCDEYRAGTAKPYWKSGGVAPKEKQLLDSVVASNLEQFVSSGWTVLGVYYSDDGCLRKLAAATNETQTKNTAIARVAEFSLAENDWPLDVGTFDRLPRLFVFKDGKLIKDEIVADTESEIVDQIFSCISAEEL